MCVCRVLQQFTKYTAADWEEKVCKWWAEHKKFSREEAMMEYLKVAEGLEMFGVNVSFVLIFF